MDSTAFIRLTVLVVDDIDASRDALRGLVEQLGHEAPTARSGDEALRRLEAERIDVVLLDLLMPDIDGFEISSQVRARMPGRWLPIIVTSSLEGEAHVIKALAHGADECLARPVSPDLLAARLRHYGRILALQTGQSVLAQRQRDILDNILDAVLTVDEDETIVEANLAACRTFSDGMPGRITGRPLRAVTGLGLQQMLWGNGRPELQRGEDHRFPAEVSGSQWSEDGRVRTTLVVRDLTERLRSERMRDEFLATVSHELRTPLTSILGAIGLLASGAAGVLPATALPFAAAAQRNGERLSRLIDDILDLTKLEGDRMVMSLRPMRLAQLLGDALSANQGYAERAGVRLALDIEPGRAGDDNVRVDPDRFLQVMANLLSNAIKHSPRGGTVSVHLRTAPRGLSVGVRDEGPGIDPAFRAALFEKFSQADASDRRALGGTGLGLHIAKLLVERMGGRIAAPPERKGQRGAEFEVWLPAMAAGQPGEVIPPTDFGILLPDSQPGGAP
ncbi:MAG: response regulator [Gammaproteobacteria bacterium]|nr:response regulator [Gammaproteobacteria bacterium]